MSVPKPFLPGQNFVNTLPTIFCSLYETAWSHLKGCLDMPEDWKTEIDKEVEETLKNTVS
tara:strand:- start:1429 stop:1608 length:180 start_codon:yes stop_codon:yes gene_type:complete